MNADPIQTQRETWLRARIARAEREKEYAAGEARLAEAVARAKAREAEEEQTLEKLIEYAKASFDAYKAVPQGMEEVTPEEGAAIDTGAVFGGFEGGAGAEGETAPYPQSDLPDNEWRARELGQPLACTGDARRDEAAP